MPCSRSHSEGVIEPGYDKLSQSDSRICVTLSYARLFFRQEDFRQDVSILWNLPHSKIAMGDIRLMESCRDPGV